MENWAPTEIKENLMKTEKKIYIFYNPLIKKNTFCVISLEYGPSTYTVNLFPSICSAQVHLQCHFRTIMVYLYNLQNWGLSG